MKQLQRIPYLLGLTCFLFFFPTAVRSAPQGVSENAEIIGAIRDAATHDPVVSARVDLMSPNGMASPTRYTNTDGEFSFDRVGDGDYHLIVKKMGYKDQQVDVSVVASHQSRVELELLRETSDSAPAPASAETISAHQLTVPEKARDDYVKGKDLLAKKDYSAAVAEFEKAIREYPSYYEAFAEMGVAQYMQGQAPAARVSLQKSIDLSDGKYPEAMFDLADVLSDIGDFTNAERLARQEIELEETSWRGHFELARALQGMKRFPEAEQSAKKAAELNGQYRQTYVILTNIHIATRQYAAAEQDIDAYLKLDSTSPASEQMRTTRAQLAKALTAAPPRPAQAQQ